MSLSDRFDLQGGAPDINLQGNIIFSGNAQYPFKFRICIAPLLLVGASTQRLNLTQYSNNRPSAL